MVESIPLSCANRICTNRFTLAGTESTMLNPQATIRARRLAWLSIIALKASASILLAQPARVPTEDARNTQIPNTDTHLPLPHFTDLATWEARKAVLRNQILVSAGLSPMPENTPLHAQVFGKLESKDYTIEKVLIETLPGFYLGGNLYRPRNGSAKHPAILNPHGHWPYGRLENQPLYSGPSLGITLARQGYVVFAYDMVGYTDTIQLPHRFGSPEQSLWSFGPLGLQLWDSVRALDFLASLDDVDSSRLGITGASGGGTQAFLLAAVDDRLAFAAPVNMVSAIMQGGDLCENAPGLRLNTSNVEIAALFAPKPMLLVSATGDWTRNVPREEFPAIQRIYALYGKADQVSVTQIEAPHNFNQQSREAVYHFLSTVNPGISAPAELTEHDIDVPPLQDMLALSNRTLPAGALALNGLFDRWKQLSEAQNGQLHDRDFLRNRLRQTLAIEIPQNVLADIHGQQTVLTRADKGDRIPGIWFPGANSGAVPIAIVVNPKGSAAALKGEIVNRLRSQGRSILLINAFQTGAAIAPRPGDPAKAAPSSPAAVADEEDLADAAAGSPKFLTFNVSDDAARVQDIVTAMAWAGKDHRAIEIYATGDAAIWSTFAAAVSGTPVSLHLDHQPTLTTGADYVQHFNVPGILRAGGLSVAEELIQSR